MRTAIGLMAAVSICAAQGPRGPRPGPLNGSPGLDMARVQTITGTVAAVDIGYGMQYPSIKVDNTVIKVAPVWYLLDQGFELRTGDTVSVVAAPSNSANDPYLHAVEITKTSSNLRIVLRDASGVPLWTANRRGAGGPMLSGGCLDPSTAATVNGTVDKVNMGLGIQMAALVLKTADDKLLVFKLGPERVLLAADVELKAGDVIAVKYAAETCNDELVVLSFTAADGLTVTLRNDDGTPAWR
jgi:hypothetical protein